MAVCSGSDSDSEVWVDVDGGGRENMTAAVTWCCAGWELWSKQIIVRLSACEWVVDAWLFVCDECEVNVLDKIWVNNHWIAWYTSWLLKLVRGCMTGAFVKIKKSSLTKSEEWLLAKEYNLSDVTGGISGNFGMWILRWLLRYITPIYYFAYKRWYYSKLSSKHFSPEGHVSPGIAAIKFVLNSDIYTITWTCLHDLLTAH